MDLFENNLFAVELFDKFKAEVRIKEEYSVFNRFAPYSLEEADHIKFTALKPSKSVTLEPLMKSTINGTANSTASSGIPNSMVRGLGNRKSLSTDLPKQAPVPAKTTINLKESSTSFKLQALRSRDLNLA